MMASGISTGHRATQRSIAQARSASHTVACGCSEAKLACFAAFSATTKARTSVVPAEFSVCCCPSGGIPEVRTSSHSVVKACTAGLSSFLAWGVCDPMRGSSAACCGAFCNLLCGVAGGWVSVQFVVLNGHSHQTYTANPAPGRGGSHPHSGHLGPPIRERS